MQFSGTKTLRGFRKIAVDGIFCHGTSFRNRPLVTVASPRSGWRLGRAGQSGSLQNGCFFHSQSEIDMPLSTFISSADIVLQ